MASDPQRNLKADEPEPVKPAPDPWGIKRAEKLLTSLQGVLSARVVTNGQGDVTEIHVLVQAGTMPKSSPQIKRFVTRLSAGSFWRPSCIQNFSWRRKK